MKKPSAILTSDWHLREDTPVCRTDNFWETQWKKVDFVAQLQREYNCFVYHAGDLFHHWKPSPYLLRETMLHLPIAFYTVYGQHDLPQHSLELKYKSGISVLEQAGKVIVLDEASWGQTPANGSRYFFKNKNILVWHNFTYVGKEPFPGCNSPKAHVLLEKYKQFDLILTGDNHQSFTSHGLSGNLLVNPGSLMRQTAAQIDFQPKVYLWYAEDNIVETVDVPIEQGVITREHIEKVQERDERIDAFISSLKTGWEMSLSFEDNMKMFFETNRVRKDIKDIIYEAMEG